jgi:multidrug efflux pump subunit AcrB
MKKAISWMAENHVTANLLMLLVIFTGLISLKFINSEVFPQISFNMISVQVLYPGASPEDIEKSICLKVEEAMAGVDGIDKITCTASENVALATARLSFGQDVYTIKNKIQSAIDRIRTFPEGAEKPVVSDVERQASVIQLGLYGDMNEKTLKNIAEQIKDDLFNLYGISHVTIVGTKNHEISINVNENNLRKYHMTFNEIILAIKKGSLDLPTGKIERKNGDILLRTNALGKTKQDYDNIIVRANKNGIVRLKDVATVKDDFEESDLRTFFDTRPAALLLVKRAENESAITIQKQVKEYLQKSKTLWPKGVKIVPWRDMTKVLKARLNMLINNAIFGFILVFIVLALFLDLRLAFWVSSGIFISFNGAFIIMTLTNTTINLISLFGFIVVLGIVVDDAIVVGESIFSFREKGLPVLEASKKGALFVSTPVVFSVLTTVAAFSLCFL